MAKQTKKNEDCGQPLPENTLSDFYGGFGPDLLDFTRLRVKCPVKDCSFECNTFGEMNMHMRKSHPERC